MEHFNHAFDVAFTVRSDHTGDEVTAEEILAALRARLSFLEDNPNEVLEAVGLPFDTYLESA